MCTARQRVWLTITGPGPSFLKHVNLGRAADPKGTMSYRTEGGISIRPWGQGLSKGRRSRGEGEGVAGGLEQGGWSLGRVSMGLGGWGLDRERDGRSDIRSLGRLVRRMDGKYRLCSIGLCPLWVRCSKSFTSPFNFSEIGDYRNTQCWCLWMTSVGLGCLCITSGG